MKLKGKFKQYRTHLDDTKWLVAPFYINARDGVKFPGTITATGVMFEKPFDMDLEYELEGEIVNDPRWGQQFKFISYIALIPTSKATLVTYISKSSNFETIGLMEAKKIVDHFGENLFEDIYNDPNIVNDYNASDQLRENIKKGVYKQYRKFKVESLFLNKGVERNLALKITNHILYSSDDIEKYINVKLGDLYFGGILFYSEFKHLFEKMELDNELMYLSVSTYHLIETMIFENQSTLLDYDKTLATLQSRIAGTSNSFTMFDIFDDLIDKRKKAIRVDKYITLDYYYEFESDIATKLNKIANQDEMNLASEEEIRTYLREYETNTGFSLDEIQIGSIIKSVNSHFSIISGGPGTGKSTLIAALYFVFTKVKQKKQVALLAPTGRVAKRIGNSAGAVALTFHRYLGLAPINTRFEDPQVSEDVEIIIIDEFSMVGTVVFALMFKGTPKLKKLIVLGDINQLPSIDPGNLLGDLINSNKFVVSFLTKNYRQGDGSSIVEFASEVLKSINEPASANAYKYLNTSSISFIEADDSKISSRINELAKVLDKNVDKLNWQVISPKRNDQGSIADINAILQSENKKPAIKISNQSTFVLKEGDKVIHVVNDTVSDLYNGDIGIVSSFDFKDKTNTTLKSVEIDFDQKTKSIERVNLLKKIELGYAITIHKSQGSEFDYVIMALPSNARRMLFNNLIYTAITRAKKKLVIVGTRESFDTAIKTKQSNERITLIKKLLEN